MSTEAERLIYWEKAAKKAQASSDYYQQQLVEAHAQIGRLVMQMSERWDSANITKYFPTNNLHRKRTVNNPAGE